MNYARYKKATLLIESIESSLLALKMELLELDEGKETNNIKNSNNIFKLEDLILDSIDEYEPNYHEEKD